MALKFTILGCGSSGGVPRPALGWGDCDPANPKNRRRRTSLLVERRSATGITPVLVDTSPDLREQLIESGVDWLDAVLITHEHADHTHGIDDLRGLFIRHRRRLDVYLDEHTAKTMRARFGYCFQSPPGSEYPPIANEHRLVPGQALTVRGAGGPIAALGGLDIWIVDALRYRPHPSHWSVDEALAWIDRLKPKRAILTNLHSDLDYAALRAKLPPHVEPAFDGMVVELADAEPARAAGAI